MSPNVWVAPAGAAATTLVDVESVLSARRLSFTVLDIMSPGRQPLRTPTTVAVIVGGAVDPSMLDVLRFMTEREVPTLVLVEELTEHQEVLLLGAGAVDVVGVPTTRARLDSRLAAHYRNNARRSGSTDPTPGTLISLADGVELWPARREVWVGERPVSLTRTEFDLLLALADDPERVLTREELAQHVGDPSLGARALESHLSRLRLKVREAGGPRLVESVRGVGYRLRSRRGRGDRPR